MTSPGPLHIPPRVERRGDVAHQTSRRHNALPDLRFEYSYLKSISSVYRQPSMPPLHRRDVSTREKPFVSTEASLVDSTDAQSGAETTITQSLCGVPISIEWEQLLWITTRDQVSRCFQSLWYTFVAKSVQVLSPFLQGALWYVSSLITQNLPCIEPSNLTHDARLWLAGEL